MYVDVQWSTDNSTWTTLQDGNAISSGATETYTISSAQSHGTTIYWQYRASSSGNPSSGSYTSATSRTVSCETLTFTLSQSMGTCSGGQQVPSIEVTNTGNVTGYFDVQYKLTLNGSDITSWTTLKDGISISASSSATYSITAKDQNYQVSWQVRAGTSNPSSGSYTSAGTGLIVSCVSAITLTDSQSLGSCAAGSATSTLSLQNSSGSSAYVTAEYSTDGGSNWTVHTDAQEADNLTITNGLSLIHI